MTGYNVAHGDTAAVQLDLDNEEGAYQAYMSIIRRVAWWDDDDATWNDIGKASRAVADYVTDLRGQTRGTDDAKGRYGEIHDADLDTVDWEQIVSSVLAEENLAAGRDYRAGLD